MSLFTAEGLGYPEAINLIKELRQNKIEANVTAGGVALHPSPDQVNLAQAICKEHKASFSAGYSRHQKDIMMQGSRDHLERVTNNSISIIKEWEE